MCKNRVVEIITLRTFRFSARVIHLGMWIYCVLRGLPIKKTYNHLEIKTGNITSGAIDEGVKSRPWLPYYKSLDNVELKCYSFNLTDKEFKRSKEYLKKSEGTKYEYSMFLWHFIRIITGNWMGDKTEKKLFCYEHGIRWLNYVKNLDLDPFMNPYEFENTVSKLLK